MLTVVLFTIAIQIQPDAVTDGNRSNMPKIVLGVCVPKTAETGGFKVIGRQDISTGQCACIDIEHEIPS